MAACWLPCVKERLMPVKLICASHSPLMEFASPQDSSQEQKFVPFCQVV